MFSKLYEKIKKIIKENIIEILIFLIALVVSLIPLPYYVDMPGGLINTSNRVKVDSAYERKGSFNLAYVSEARATPIIYVLAKILDNWDLVKEKDMVIEGQSVDDLYTYQKILLQQVSSNAKIVAYKKANKEYKIETSKFVIGYIENDAITSLKVGDEIVSIDGTVFNSLDEIKYAINSKKSNSIINFEVLVDNKKVTRTAKVRNIKGSKIIGIGIFPYKIVETNPKCLFNFSSKESGPSGGLMTALTIYDSLIKEDLTHGLVISGTGTIEEDGTVGSIGGVKYKLAGVVKKHADVFLVPAGENYKEAIKLKKEKNYNIDIVSIATFDDAVNYLSNLNSK